MFEDVDVENKTLRAEVMPFYEEHQDSVELLMAIHQTEQISRIALREYLRERIMGLVVSDVQA